MKFSKQPMTRCGYPEDCTRHAVGQLSLSKLIFSEITKLVEGVKINEKAIIKTLTQRLVGSRRISATKREKEVAALKQRIHKSEAAISKLYEGRVTGQISEDVFLEQMLKSESERLQAEKRLSILKVSEQEAESKLGGIQNWIRLIKENATITELNRDLLLALINKIEVGEGRIVNGIKEQAVTIHYNFIGVIEK